MNAKNRKKQKSVHTGSTKSMKHALTNVSDKFHLKIQAELHCIFLSWFVHLIYITGTHADRELPVHLFEEGKGTIEGSVGVRCV